MKLTPLDIHHKEFSLALRGYKQDEVDQFLDDVADELERLFKENIDLSEKLEAATEKVRGYADIEKTLHNTLLAAQQSAEDIKAKAEKEGEALLKDAELKAKELVQTALAEKQKTQSEFMRIKQAEDEFRMRFRQVLEDHMRNLHAVPVPSDVAAMVGIAAGEPAPSAPESAPVAEVSAVDAEPAAAAPEAPEPVVADAADDAQSRPRAHAVRREPLAAEPPRSGFVQSLTLGEVEGPDVRPDAPTFEEPAEFTIRRIGDVGERDDDLDIEEID